MKKQELLEQLADLLDVEHPGCEDNTCVINREMLEEYPHHIAEIFSSSGAASLKFQRLAAKLLGRLKSPNKMIIRECNQICRRIPHMTCDCNAVIWDFSYWYTEGEAIRCASCGAAKLWVPEKD